MMDRPDHSSDANEAQLVYTKATKAEHARDYNLAYRLYVKSAELYLHLTRTGKGGEADLAKWKTNAAKAIQRAEKIKASVEGPSNAKSALGGVSNITPVGIDHFSMQEQSYILQKGGLVNGRHFPPWDNTPTRVSCSQSPYSDPDGQPTLSLEQANVSAVWSRPLTSCLATSRQILPSEIVQQVVADCSVCSSISVCLEHSRRFGSKMAQAAVTMAYDHTQSGNGSPEARILGRYDVKLFFNGTWRRVGNYYVVDDMLLHHPLHGFLMCMSVVSHRNDSVPIWPSILEKSYMKLMGGYEFPGSNSSIDLHALTGWIPENFDTKSYCEKNWRRIHDGFHKGNCMVTLGTGKKVNHSWQYFKLLPSHSYAVIDLQQHEGTRILTILDTWHNSDTNDYSNRKPALTHQIAWSDAMHVFDGVYVSWDPSVWHKMLMHHGRLMKTADERQISRRQVYLQYNNLVPSTDQEIWVLLTRHVTNTSRQNDFISLAVEIEDDVTCFPGEVTIAATGHYTNNPHALAQITVPSSWPNGVLSIFISYDGDSTEVGFTLSVYAGADISIAWDKTIRDPPFMKRIEGVLTSKNSGGNWTYPTFKLNPQYHLWFHRGDDTRPVETKLNLTLQTSKDVPVNLSLTWSQGNRMFDLVAKDVVATSGAFSYGLARLSLSRELSARDFTVIVSPFEPLQLEEFSLIIQSSESFDIKAIPQEGAGMYSKVIRGSWNSATAAGGPTSMQYARNPTFEIELPSQAQVIVRLQLLRSSPAVSLNVTLFPASSDGSLKRHITTSGAYSDAVCGVVTPQVYLKPAKYWVVPSTHKAGIETEFQLYLYTDCSSVKITERSSNVHSGSGS